MTRLRGTAPRLASLVGIAALAGCGAASARGATACSAPTDCTVGTVCDSVSHVCVATTAQAQLVFVATPPSGQSSARAAATTTGVQMIRASSTVDLVMAAPRDVFGTVSIPGVGGVPAIQVPASLRFRRDGAAPAEGQVETVARSAVDLRSDGRSYTFLTSLLPGNYEARVMPVDLTSAPPLTVAMRVEPDAMGAALELGIVYPSPIATVSGRLIDETTQLPMPGVMVQLVDPSTDDRLISTIRTTATGSDPMVPSGSFSLWKSPNTTDSWALQITSTPPSSSNVYPNAATGRLVYRVPHSAFTTSTLRVSTVVGLAGAVSGTCETCVYVEGQVEGETSSGSRRAVAGATVNLHASDVLRALPAGHTAWFDAQAVTDSGGTFRALLLPGTYTAVITPPSDGTFAITSSRLEVSRSLVGQVLTVRPTIPVGGTVVDSQTSSGIAGARVEAIPLGGSSVALSASVPVPRQARPAQAYTEPTGEFLLSLDEGDYVLVVHPPDGSGLPSQLFLVPGIHWTASAAGGPTPSPVRLDVLSIAPPIAVSGTVFDSTMAATGGSTVRTYARYAVPGGEPIDVEVAHAGTDGAGRYSLLAPSVVIR